mgnify:CR=1 FL=1
MNYRLKNKNGILASKNVSKYFINWDKPSASKIQTKVKNFLKEYWAKYLVYEEFPVYGTRLRVDFLNASKMIAIEVQGEQHDKVVKHFHGNKQGFFESLERDRQKREWLDMNDFQLIEISDKETKTLDLSFFKNLDIDIS